MEDSYHTIGAEKDRARTWAIAEKQNQLLERIAGALERIAGQLEVDSEYRGDPR